MENEIYSNLANQMLSVFSSLTETLVNMIVQLLPIIIPILAAYVVINVGLHVFNMFSGTYGSRELFIGSNSYDDSDIDWEELESEEVDWSSWEEHFGVSED